MLICVESTRRRLVASTVLQLWWRMEQIEGSTAGLVAVTIVTSHIVEPSAVGAQPALACAPLARNTALRSACNWQALAAGPYGCSHAQSIYKRSKAPPAVRMLFLNTQYAITHANCDGGAHSVVGPPCTQHGHAPACCMQACTLTVHSRLKTQSSSAWPPLLVCNILHLQAYRCLQS